MTGCSVLWLKQRNTELCASREVRPQIAPHTAALLRKVFQADRDDAAFVNEIATA